MADGCYERVEESGSGGAAYAGVFRSTSHTRGPWDPRHQHGGPPAALLARAVERLGHAPRPGIVARATVEILSPVPVGDLRVEAEVVREGGRVALCEGRLYAVTRADATPHADDPEPGVPVARITAWRIRTTREPLDVPMTPVDPPPARHGEEIEPPEGWGRGFIDAVRWGWVEGSFHEPGPATVWTRLLVPIVAGEEPSGVQRALAVADAGSGISAVAHPRDLLFVNTELTVHFTREPVGEDVWMRSHTRLDPCGVGLATTTLGDHGGALGAAAQSLFVDARR